MKNNKQNLDEYFKLARNSEPIFDIDEARHLVENSATPVSKLNNFLGNLTMNAILLTTVAAVLWFVTLGQQDNSNQNTSNTEISKIQDQNESKNSKIQFNTNEDNQKKEQNESSTRNNQNQIALNSLNDDKKQEKSVSEKSQTINVKGVNTIELTDSELENLGVTKENGKYYLWIGKKHPQKVAISKNSVMMNTLDKSKKENDNIWPKMITDMKGYKYLLAFENDNMQFMRTTSKNKNTDKNIINTDSLISNHITFNDSFTWTDKKELTEDIEVSVINMKDSVFEINLRPNQRIIMNEDSEKMLIDTVFGAISVLNFDKINNGTSINGSTISNSNKQMLIYSTNHVDSVANFEIEQIGIRINKNNEVIASNIEDEFDKYVRVNKLIPVKITLDDGAEMLLWYDSDVEFLNKLPKDMANQIEPEYAAATDTDEFCEAPVTGGEKYFDIWRSCAGAIEHLVIYPNPSSGPINAKFILKENRMVKATLHDLNGKLISELSEWERLEKGEQTIKLENKINNAGMYLVVIQTNFNEQAVQRIIKE